MYNLNVNKFKCIILGFTDQPHTIQHTSLLSAQKLKLTYHGNDYVIKVIFNSAFNIHKNVIKVIFNSAFNIHKTFCHTNIYTKEWRIQNFSRGVHRSHSVGWYRYAIQLLFGNFMYKNDITLWEGATSMRHLDPPLLASHLTIW